MSYRKIHSKFWTDPGVGKLDPLEKLVFLYLLTSVYAHMSGLFQLRPEHVAIDTGISPEDVGDIIARLQELGFIEFDAEEKTVLVKKMAFYQIENPKSLKSAYGHIEMFGNNKLAKSAAALLDQVAEKRGWRLVENGALESAAAGRGKKSQRGNHQAGCGGVGKDEGPASDVPVEKVLDMYHKLCPSLPKVQFLSKARKKAIGQAWEYLEREEYDPTEALEYVFSMAEASDFLTGRQDGKWCANFDWLLQPKNLMKVFEGAYNGTTSGGKE